MTDYVVSGLLAFAGMLSLWKKENAYDLLLDGAGKGLKLIASIVPSLVLLLTAVSMLRASGAVEALSTLLSPVFSFFLIWRVRTVNSG